MKTIKRLFYLSFIFCTSILNAQKPEIKRPNVWPRGITYEIFVMAFKDSNGDTIGDIKGITSKLDYLSNLGVEAVWLMPISTSPSYHKYDVVDYYSVDPQYGTMSDFRDFIKKAHEKNIKVVIDVVINHSSYHHPWFASARGDKKSPYRDYYVWSSDTAIINKNPKRWNKTKESDERYYSVFWGGMPDLNYDNQRVREEVKKIGKHWLLDVGVDGLRLDAAAHIYPLDQATKSHEWWVEFGNEMRSVKKDVYLVGEVWQDNFPLAPFYKGLTSNFNFVLSDAILRALKTEKDTFLIDNLIATHAEYVKANPNFVDATFLTNHDQVRIASEVNGNKDKIKLAASLLFTLPGNPYIYYGEELGMLGIKPDEHMREPFLWSSDKKDNANWIVATSSTPQTVEPHSKQEKDPNSIFNLYKKLIQLRKNSPTLSLGTTVSVPNDNRNLIVFKREYDGESLLVIHNLSKTAQPIDGKLIGGKVWYSSSPMKSGIVPYGTIIYSNK